MESMEFNFSNFQISILLNLRSQVNHVPTVSDKRHHSNTLTVPATATMVSTEP